MFDPNTVRQDFPIYRSKPGLIYLDSAATALKPQSVIDAMNAYYFEYSANTARGLYPLAETATAALDAARETIAHFINAERRESVVFTANATHAINLVALGLEHIMSGKKNIVVTELEHHSNYLPWKELAKRTGADFRTAHFDTDGMIDHKHLLSLIDAETTVVAFSAVSNVFGTMSPVKEIIAKIREKNPRARVLIDACQAAGHIEVDIQDWDADFVVFSGHKLFGPTGIGVLAGKSTSLKRLTPMNVGGGTVLDACSPVTEYKPLPDCLEGGTPNIAGAIGLGAAIKYIRAIGLEEIHVHETQLVSYLLAKFRENFGDALHLLGTSETAKRIGLVSFALGGVHPHDLAHLLGEQSICVRAGEHCAAPLHRAVNLPASTRVSLSMYNTEDDIDQLILAMQKIHSTLAL